MQKWEYVTHAVHAAPLADLGQDGWRLVTVDDGIMFFERPMEEPESVAGETTAEAEPVVTDPPVADQEPPAPVVAEPAAVEPVAEPVAEKPAEEPVTA